MPGGDAHLSQNKKVSIVNIDLSQNQHHSELPTQFQLNDFHPHPSAAPSQKSQMFNTKQLTDIMKKIQAQQQKISEMQQSMFSPLISKKNVVLTKNGLPNKQNLMVISNQSR